MQVLNISGCFNMEEQGMCAIAKLTQLTNLGTEELSWFVNATDMKCAGIQDFLHALTGEQQLSPYTSIAVLGCTNRNSQCLWHCKAHHQ